MTRAVPACLPLCCQVTVIVKWTDFRNHLVQTIHIAQDDYMIASFLSLMGELGSPPAGAGLDAPMPLNPGVAEQGLQSQSR